MIPETNRIEGRSSPLLWCAAIAELAEEAVAAGRPLGNHREMAVRIVRDILVRIRKERIHFCEIRTDLGQKGIQSFATAGIGYHRIRAGLFAEVEGTEFTLVG